MRSPESPVLSINGLVKDVGPLPTLDGRMLRVVSDVSLIAGRGEVTALLGSIEDDLRALSEAITYFYFSHAELRVS